MDRLPLSIVCNIFSRVPRKCLACCQCVSKEWCNYTYDPYLLTLHDERVIEEPIPILYHFHLSHERKILTLCFHVLKSKQTGAAYHTDVSEPKEGHFLEFLHKKPLSNTVRIKLLGSCNGMICLSQCEDGIVTRLVVVHPLRRECYVPPLPMRFNSAMVRESCGLGFDASTNTLKMVFVMLKPDPPSKGQHLVRNYLCTMVHEIGTNSWREIPQVPPYRIKDGAVFANGCLHWLVSYIDSKTNDGERPVIWFDVKKEGFGLIDPPKRMCDLERINDNCSKDHLVILNGEVGYVCCKTMEVWVLKQKDWVPHCRFGKQIDPYSYLQVLGCWNKYGDMLIRISGHKFSVYNLKSGVLHKTSISAGPDNPNIFMHPNKLFSIRGIGNNSFPMKKKTDLKQSCQRLLSYY